MTIRKRLARSNLVMILIPVAIAAVLLLAGGGLALLLLKRVYLPRLGLSMAALHETGEQLEAAFDGAKAVAAIYGGAVLLALLAAVAFTNLYLTRHLFRHIQMPLDALVSGVKRIRDGDLDSPIGYRTEDEFRPACDALDEMALRLKTSLEAQSRQQQQKQELIAGMSHDLKSPLTAIRAYTEGLLDGVAKDEASQQRYLQTIYARVYLKTPNAPGRQAFSRCTAPFFLEIRQYSCKKMSCSAQKILAAGHIEIFQIHPKESELEALVNRLFAFAKLDLSEAPAGLMPLEISEPLHGIADGYDAEGQRRGDAVGLPDGDFAPQRVRPQPPTGRVVVRRKGHAELPAAVPVSRCEKGCAENQSCKPHNAPYGYCLYRCGICLRQDGGRLSRQKGGDRRPLRAYRPRQGPSFVPTENKCSGQKTAKPAAPAAAAPRPRAPETSFSARGSSPAPGRP